MLNDVVPGSREFRLARAAEMLRDDPVVTDNGIVVEDLSDEITVMAMQVQEHHANSHGVCHGGILLLLADTAAGYATNSGEPSSVWVTSSSNSVFIKPTVLGSKLRATCTLRWSGGGRMRVYEVVVTDPAGDSVLLMQCQMMRVKEAKTS